MIVATRSQNVARLGLGGPMLSRAGAPLPEARHHMAVIQTAWGVCGTVWRPVAEKSDTNQESKGFIDTAADGLLCHILTPGLPVDQLRQQLLSRHRFASEVLGDRAGNFHPEVVPDWFGELVRYLRAYYSSGLRAGMGTDFNDTWTFWKSRLDWSQVTPFQRGVLEVTAEIPRGERLTYGEIAKRVGKPRASRAVGAALGSNPWPVLVPCHRVVGKNGSMTGFSAPGGVKVKQRMLEMEQGLLG